MNTNSNYFKGIGIVASVVFIAAAIITFSGPNLLVYGRPAPHHGMGLLFSLFYLFAVASSIGLILNQKWAQLSFVLVLLIVLVRAIFVVSIIGKGFFRKQIGVASTYIQENGERHFKLIVSGNPASSCERVAMPVWSFTVDKDVMSMPTPMVFEIDESGKDARAYRFVDSFGLGIPVTKGKLTISKINSDKSLSGWFSVFAKETRSLGSFKATWCGEKNEVDALKKGEEDYARHLKESGGTTNR